MNEIWAALRGMVLRGVLHQVDDTGSVQTADVETGEGVSRFGAHVIQPPGLACNPGTGGVMAVVLAPGADQGEPLVLLAATEAGMGNLPAGGTAVYALDGGAIVRVFPGGEIEIEAATKVTVRAPEIEAVATTKITATAPQVELGQAGAVVNILGTLKVNGVTVAVP